MSYLKKNSEKVDIKFNNPVVEDLLKLSKQELSFAYDSVINALGDREAAIEYRLRKSIEHFG